MDYISAEKNPIIGFFEIVLTWLKTILAIKIPIGDYFAFYFNQIQNNFHVFWTSINKIINLVLLHTVEFLLAPPLLILCILVFAGVLEKNWHHRIILITTLLTLAIVNNLLTADYHVILIAGFCCSLFFYIIISDNILPKIPVFLTATIIIALTIFTCFNKIAFWPPQATFILTFALLGWFIQKRISVIIIILITLLLILNQGYWYYTITTLAILLWCCSICLIIGIPMGIFLAHQPKLYRRIKPIVHFMQSMPAFISLIPSVIYFGFNTTLAIITTLIFILPISIDLTATGIKATPALRIEAGRAFGASAWQLLWTIKLSSALPHIRVAIRKTIMLTLYMIIIATCIDTTTIEMNVLHAMIASDISRSFETGFLIMLFAFMLNRMFCPKQVYGEVN